MGWFSKSTPPPPEIEPATPPRPYVPPAPAYVCSFCGKAAAEVKKLIAGPSAYICDECVVQSMEIVEEAEAEEAARAPIEVPSPAALQAAFDAQVVGQAVAKRALIAALRRHFLGSAQPGSGERAPRVLLVGPSGSGKTSFGRALCSLTTLPAYHADAGRLSESGYVGEDLENLISALLHQAKDDVDAARRGILFLDGLEKLKALRAFASRDISGEGVQRELIRLLDGMDLAIPHWDSPRRHPMMNVKRFGCESMFIVAAVRVDAAAMPAGVGERALRKAVIDGGLLPELLARFDRVVALPPLDVEGLDALLLHPRGPLTAARKVAEALGGALEYTREARRALASAAAESSEGAWMLGRIVNRQLEERLGSESPGRAERVEEATVRALIAD
jgi:ATP-dependent Clp protease ATP-binding subunit ClpX